MRERKFTNDKLDISAVPTNMYLIKYSICIHNILYGNHLKIYIGSLHWRNKNDFQNLILKMPQDCKFININTDNSPRNRT